MPVTTIGVSGAIWGVTAQTGIICQSQGAKVTREKNEVRNESGEFCLVSFFNILQKHTVEGVFTGATGIGAAIPGTALGLANVNANNGVTAGGVYTDDADVKQVNTDFKRVAATATQYPLIM